MFASSLEVRQTFGRACVGIALRSVRALTFTSGEVHCLEKMTMIKLCIPSAQSHPFILDRSSNSFAVHFSVTRSQSSWIPSKKSEFLEIHFDGLWMDRKHNIQSFLFANEGCRVIAHIPRYQLFSWRQWVCSRRCISSLPDVAVSSSEIKTLKKRRTQRPELDIKPGETLLTSHYRALTD